MKTFLLKGNIENGAEVWAQAPKILAKSRFSSKPVNQQSFVKSHRFFSGSHRLYTARCTLLYLQSQYGHPYDYKIETWYLFEFV